MEYNLNFIKTKDLSPDQLSAIAQLKDQHWKYGIESQKEWIRKNILSDDTHLMLNSIEGGVKRLRAYLHLAAVEVQTDGVLSEMIGIGNVCVDAEVEHKGFGRLLMDTAEIYITSLNKTGILLCKPKVEGFYQSCGWKIVNGGNVQISSHPFYDIVMTDRVNMDHKTLAFNRNF